MDDIDEAIVAGLVKIGNHEAFVKALEPNVFSHQELQAWMVVRTLQGLMLYSQELRRVLRKRKCG